MKLSLLAEKIGARLAGNDAEVTGVASLNSATASDLSFTDDPKHLPGAIASKAAALVVGDFAANETAKPLLIAAQPRLAFARAASLLCPESRGEASVHASAAIGERAAVAASAAIGAHAVIEPGACIGERTRIGANCYVGAGVSIGEDCDIRPNVSIYPGTTIGNRVVVHSGAVLGSDGFGFVRDSKSGRYTKFPQIGRLEIQDDVEIGANTTIDRGALDTTVIARGVKLDNLVHIGHNVQVGEDVVIAAQSGISGSTVVEQQVIIAGQVGLGDHVRIEKGAILGGQCGVLPGKVVRGPGVLFWGTPARPLKEYLKELAVLARLAKRRKQ